MAKCYKCGERIPYFSYFIGTFKFFLKNLWRSRLLQVFECPHCKTICQEKSGSSYASIVIFAVLVLGVLIILDKQNITIKKEWFVLGFVAFYVLIYKYLWWNNISKTKEPYNFRL